MIKARIWTKEQELELNNKVDNDLHFAWEMAIKDPYPSADATLRYVYS